MQLKSLTNLYSVSEERLEITGGVTQIIKVVEIVLHNWECQQ
jgi:hypothetical protein